MKKIIVLFLLKLVVLECEDFKIWKDRYIKKGARNPFSKTKKFQKTENITEILVSEEPIVVPDFLLTGIIISGSNVYAILNDKIVQKGQSIDGFYIKDIKKSCVVLKKGMQEFFISFSQGDKDEN